MDEAPEAYSSKWLDIVVRLATILGIAFAVYQFLDTKHAARVQATLDYVKRFEDLNSGVGQADRALAAAIAKHATNIDRLRNGNIEETEFAKQRARLTAQIVDDASQGNDSLREIDSFFMSLAICIAEDVCDREAAVKFFGCYAHRHRNNFREVIAERAAFAPGFGRGVAEIAEKATGCEATDVGTVD